MQTMPSKHFQEKWDVKENKIKLLALKVMKMVTNNKKPKPIDLFD